MGEGDTSTGQPSNGEVGGDFRRQREMRGISMREIAEATKISVRFLEAIENEDFASLPAPVFTRGFIREYARQIGVDPDDIVDRYMAFVSGVRNREAAEQAALDQRISGAHSFPARWPVVVLAILAFASIGIAIGLFSRAGAPTTPSPATAGTKEVPVAQPTEVEMTAPTTEADVAPPVTESSTPEPPAETRNRLKVRIVADEDCYLTVSADGERVISGEVLHAGEVREFSIADRLLFETIGNAGGIRVSVDGVDLPPFGRRGQVVKNRVVDRSSIAR